MLLVIFLPKIERKPVMAAGVLVAAAGVSQHARPAAGAAWQVSLVKGLLHASTL